MVVKKNDGAVVDLMEEKGYGDLNDSRSFRKDLARLMLWLISGDIEVR